MAEFQEVMRQITRYCNSQNGCASCKLSKITDDHCPSDLFADDNGANIENEVMSWAAEHPEPVYPSWYAWLANMGIVPIELPPDQALMVTDIGLLKKIPADIAQKLGIEPKEG